jgi:N-acetylglucosamine-6-sulfatase
MNGPRFSLLVAVAMVICPEVSPQKAAPAPHCLEALEGATPRNIVFILSDDHRYDVMGLMGHPFVETPHMDALAREGAHLKNAFVTTSLCSPSRASILTGQFVHSHQVVDNNDLAPRGTVFFPQYLQSSGYETAFVGKWHMGGQSDAARPGFDHWISFRGQGTYYPPTNRKWRLNVNGKKVPQKGYITDELTDYAIEWLGGRSQQKPFFLFLSHKAVHHNFEPAERHKGRYAKVEIQPPVTMADTEENYRGTVWTSPITPTPTWRNSTATTANPSSPWMTVSVASWTGSARRNSPTAPLSCTWATMASCGASTA